MSLEDFPLTLSRHAFSPRDAARAGDIWRLFQDAAVIGSSRRGWTPRRYREEGCAFVVREMTVVHDREVHFGADVHATTWVSSFRRGILTDRQIHLTAEDRPLARATQRWVFVTMPALKPTRAPPAVSESFAVLEREPDVGLPEHEPAEGPVHRFAFDAWHTWMDPLAHANHPAYVDWIDEALSRVVVASGGSAPDLQPVAEQVVFRSGVQAGERVEVQTRLCGVTAGGDAVCRHEIRGGEDRLCAEATSVRRLVGGGALVVALGGA